MVLVTPLRKRADCTLRHIAAEHGAGRRCEEGHGRSVCYNPAAAGKHLLYQLLVGALPLDLKKLAYDCAMSLCLRIRPVLIIARGNTFDGIGLRLPWPLRPCFCWWICDGRSDSVAAHKARARPCEPRARSRHSHHGLHDQHVPGVGP